MKIIYVVGVINRMENGQIIDDILKAFVKKEDADEYIDRIQMSYELPENCDEASFYMVKTILKE